MVVNVVVGADADVIVAGKTSSLATDDAFWGSLTPVDTHRRTQMRVPKIRRSYDLSFQEDAVAMLQRSDRPIHGVARDLGIPFTTLHGWYKKAMAKKGKRSSVQDTALPIRDPSAEVPEEKIARLEREVTELRKENDSLKQDRAILKKAAAFFAKESE